jgi:hypothetical protein
LIPSLALRVPTRKRLTERDNDDNFEK